MKIVNDRRAWLTVSWQKTNVTEPDGREHGSAELPVDCFCELLLLPGEHLTLQASYVDVAGEIARLEAMVESAQIRLAQLRDRTRGGKP